MGYTHYFTQWRTFTLSDWQEVADGFARVVELCAERGIALDCEGGLLKRIWFNGAEDGAAETFVLNRVRPKKEEYQDVAGGGFCKTYERPYDVAVTALLALLDSCFSEHVSVSSDGGPSEWEAGVALARLAWPHKANQIKAPRDVLLTAEFKHWNEIGNRFAFVTGHDNAPVVLELKTGLRLPVPMSQTTMADYLRPFLPSGWYNQGEREKAVDKACRAIWLRSPNSSAKAMRLPSRRRHDDLRRCHFSPI